MGDGYENYTYKHLTLLNKHTGKVLAEYYGGDITIAETGWINKTMYNRKRPSVTVLSIYDLNITINAETVAYFDLSDPDPTNPIGFVDFMAFSDMNNNSDSMDASDFQSYVARM